MSRAGQLWTPEQAAILACRDRRIVIEALAGTGKTTTLREYARRNPRERFLYLVFGAENKREASASFPPNVECLTSHALARRAVGARFSHKIGELKAVDAARRYRQPMSSVITALRLVRRFVCRAGGPLRAAVQPFQGGLERSAVDLAERMWAEMCDPSLDEVPITHDGYLKLYELAAVQIEGSPTILADEFQDLNEVTLSILERQRACRIVAVGDSHQRIFGFRSTVDGLDRFEGTRFALTSSFRFGPEVAGCANAILTYKGTRHLLRGLGAPGDASPRALGRPYAYLARSNAAALLHAAGAEGPVHFVGGFRAYRAGRIRDAYLISKGRVAEVEDREFRQFADLASLLRYARQVDDVEIVGVVLFVQRFGDGVPGLMDRVEARVVDERERAEVVVTTAHKAKGLEFDEVVLGTFFDRERLVEGVRTGLPPRWAEELNLLYVGVTRARLRLHLNAEARAIVAGELPRPGVAGPRAPARTPRGPPPRLRRGGPPPAPRDGRAAPPTLRLR